MSYSLLQEKVIDPGECIGCGACARGCKHIIMIELEAPEGQKPKKLPKLKGKCILTRNGLECGNCFNTCPIVMKKRKTEEEKYRTDRQEVFLAVQKATQGITIPKIAQEVGITTMVARYEALRLVELKKLKFSLKVKGKDRDPIFTVEED